MHKSLTIFDCTYTSFATPRGQSDVAWHMPTGARFERGRDESFEQFKGRVEARLNGESVTDAATLSVGG